MGCLGHLLRGQPAALVRKLVSSALVTDFDLSVSACANAWVIQVFICGLSAVAPGSVCLLYTSPSPRD